MESQKPPKAVFGTTALTTADGNRVWLAASIAGLMRSTDSGASWSDAYLSLDPKAQIATLAIAESPTFSVDNFIISGTIDGVLISEDAGVTWTALELPAPPPVISSFVFSPDFKQDGTVFAGTLEDGVYQSTNRGKHWAAWNFGLTDPNVIDLAISPRFGQDETLFASTETGIFRSANAGRSWHDAAFPSDLAPVISLGASPLAGTSYTLFAGTEAGGLHRSTDGGDSWSASGEGITEGPVNALVFSSDYATRPQILALVAGGVVLSSDAGESWSDMRLEPAPPESITSLAPINAVGPDMELLLGLEDGSVGRANATA